MSILLFLLWILTVFIATAVISQFIKEQNKPDAAIALYVLYLAVSQVLAAKIGDFSIGSWKIVAPVAVMVFPFTFQITDIVNEFFGQKATHRMIFIAFISQILMVCFFWFSIQIAPAELEPGFFWPHQDTWAELFGTTLRITGASWISFLINENLDAIIYAKIKKFTKGKYLWIRNVFSDIPTLALDSIIFVSLAFMGEYPFAVILTMIWGQMLTKWFFGVIDTPFIYLSRGIVNGKINLFGNTESFKKIFSSK